MRVIVIGNPNVGKSAVLNRLTGSNMFVSNYAGTSIGITHTSMNIGAERISVLDTPGVYSLYSDSDDSNVIRDLLAESDALIMDVVDAANLERNLNLTYELLEQGFPVIVVLNQVDRARDMGLRIDVSLLGGILHCPVVPFSASTGEGLLDLLELLKKHMLIQRKLKRGESCSAPVVVKLDNQWGCGNCSQCSKFTPECTERLDWTRFEEARDTVGKVTSEVNQKQREWLGRVQNIIDRPFLGTLLLLLFAYACFFLLLRFIQASEGPISSLLNPLNKVLEHVITLALPGGKLSVILAKAIPEGLVIPFTIILPAMLMVNLIMVIVEDTGLLPRYSVALERVGSFFGVSGQAIIPLALGFGCRTPAVMATRILPGAAQRFVIIALLSIVIPCAATLGVLTSVIAAFHASLAVIVITMFVVMVLLGFLLGRIVSREEVFIYELPPLRIPSADNAWKKIKARFAGFFTEVLPLLLVMSIAIRALLESGWLEIFHSLEGLTRAVFGIPAEAFIAVLVTIFQRYLAPLVLLNLNLTPREATIAIAMVAMSLPCLPVMVMTIREIGLKNLLKIVALGLTTSFAVGMVLNFLLPL
jgi:ferrous iron transport protein B